jgi:hypothetical protein
MKIIGIRHYSYSSYQHNGPIVREEQPCFS